MAMRQSLVGSLRGNLQSVNLIWKKEKQTLERTIQYFDKSGDTVTLVWIARKVWYEGTAELSLGNHSGSFFISDQNDLDYTQEFQVDKQDMGVVQDILLFIDNTPMGHNFSAPIDISMAPAPELLPVHDNELESNLSDTARRPSVGDDLNDSVMSQTLKKENVRLQVENGDLRAENGDLRAEKQRIKIECYDLDGQLITVLEQLSAYQQQQGLMQERYGSLEREARKMNEANQDMKLRIEAYVFQGAKDHETIKQQQIDLTQYNENFQRMHQEREGLRARCDSLEQNHRGIGSQGRPDEWRTREQERSERSENIMQENIHKLRDEDIPSLLKDNEELKQQLAHNNQLHQKELLLARQERDALKYENERLNNNMYADGRKPIEQIAIAENGGRDTLLQMDQLSLHFEECSQSLRKLIQLLEANIAAKDCQLDRRSQELRDARTKNDKLVQEVVSRGNDINRLTSKLQTILSTNRQMTPQTRVSESGPSTAEFRTADFQKSPLEEDKIPVKFPLPSTTDLIKYQPVIKSLYHDLEDTTNKTIDFNNTPIQVLKMVYLEDPKTHIGNQVICMLHRFYFIGILKEIINYRPVPQGMGALSPITYAGIEFNQPVGQSDGSFKGVQYFETAAKCAEYLPLENVFIPV